jgi:hypothetical protein
MRGMSGLRAWLAAGAFACTAPLLAAAAELAPIAHSAQITVEGKETSTGLTLRVRPTAPGAALTVTDVAVAVGGKSERALPQADGTWLVPLPAARSAGAGRLDVFVVHDGIREVLSGHIGAPPPAATATTAAPALTRAHKQMAWWILNVVVVLIGVIAISRRMS